MTSLKIIARVLLVATLFFCAASLRKQLYAATWLANNEREKSKLSEKFSLTSIAGMDLAGHLILDSIPTEVKRFVVLRLRTSTIDDDIRHWTAINALLLPERADIEIVAYCDSGACRTALSGRAEALPFVVIAYGEVAASQAVASADVEGQFLLLDGKLKFLRRVQWRASEKAAAEVVKEILH